MTSMSYHSDNVINPELSVRLVIADHYMSKPIPGLDCTYSEFRGSDIKQVPVLRIFGPSSDGRKACIHVHGVFPYFYIPCGFSWPDSGTVYQLASSLDKALNVSLKQATSTNQHVYKITLVKGIPFYGYHSKEHLFYKIFLYSPNLLKQAVDLLQNGAVMGQTFQPYEAHLSFTLQFFIDFNLFGMSYVDFERVKFRKSNFKFESLLSSDEIISSEREVKAETMCYYEGDCLASHIINRQRVGKGEGIENPGLEEVWKKEMERRKKLNLSITSKSLTQRDLGQDGTETHRKFKQMLVIKLSSDEPVNPVKETQLDNTYPAESLDNSQLISVSDISQHETSQMAASQNDGYSDVTLVDETIALNCSIRQNDHVTLDSEDLDLVGLLQDMDAKDSVKENSESFFGNEQSENDDLEYTQVFDEDHLLQSIDFESQKSQEAFKSSDPHNWEDSFWDNANIPQLDGACDDGDESINEKDSKRRKVLSRPVGLSRPKRKRSNIQPLVISQVSQNETSPSKALRDLISPSKNKCKASRHKVKLITDCQTKVEQRILSEKEPLPLEFDRIAQKVKQEPVLNVLNVSRIAESEDIDEIEASQIISKPSEFKGKKKTKIKKYDKELNKSVILPSFNIKLSPVAGPSGVNNKSILKSHSNEAANDSSRKNNVKFHEPSTILKDDTKQELSSPEELFMNEFQNNQKCSPDFALSPNKKEFSDLEYSSDDENPGKLGIKSFYDITKIFPFSSDESDTDPVLKENDDKIIIKNENMTMLQEELVSHEKVSHVRYYSESSSGSTNIILTPLLKPPTRSEVVHSLDKYNIPHVSNPKPFFSNFNDVGKKIEVGDVVLQLRSNNTKHLEPFDTIIEGVKSIDQWRKELFLGEGGLTQQENIDDLAKVLASNRRCILEPLMKAPFASEVKGFSKNINNIIIDDFVPKYEDEIEPEETIGLNETLLTPENKVLNDGVKKEFEDIDISMHVSMQPDGSFLCFGDNPSQKQASLDVMHVDHDYLTIMVIELITIVRDQLQPDPQFDEIRAIFYTITNDCPSNHFLPRKITKIIAVDPQKHDTLNRCGLNQNITYVESETELIALVFSEIRSSDPDIFCGYEVELHSWGYFLDRCEVLGIEALTEVSRVTEKSRQKNWKHDEKDYQGRIIGRIIFDVWRMLRSEIALSSYTFEATMYSLLNERVPCYSCEELWRWWNHESRTLRWLPVEYYLTRISGTLRMMEKLDFINRTSELARLFGLQWWEVISRGSQYRVESLMLRAARPLNLVALSPSVRQKAAMKAPEILPLILEPESRYYSDPVIVLDFQSLYPSMMIAYNYCFSTCIGNIRNIQGDTPYEFGAWRLRIPKSKLVNLSEHDMISWSPIGAGFVTPEVRRGVLPSLLRRILAARQAVKKNMKNQTDEDLKRAMHSRQLGLKLIANVTYGYTAANFSGRMPLVELGDSVVAKGRETLERAIKLVKENKEWNVKVVYGDTDSMFVLVPGADRSRAFEIGRQIADAVTADNPSPVVLKLEKVYQPCILQTKKRYVGYMYESADQKEAVYEAKGIETVRRDGCPAGVKLLKNSLCELFTSADMSRVKALVCKVLSDVSDGRLPLHELFFTREYNGVNGYRPGAAAPPLEIARRLAARDPRSAPVRRWRMSWLVSAGPPQTPLVKLAKTPQEALKDLAKPYALYYITRVLLPPLARCLSLVGQDVYQWYKELPRRTESGFGGIAVYMRRGECAVCCTRANTTLCIECEMKPRSSIASIMTKLRDSTRAVHNARYICASCTNHSESQACQNLECPVMWRRHHAQLKLNQTVDTLRALPPGLCDIVDF